MNLTWRTATLEKPPPDTIMSTDKRVIDHFEYLNFLDKSGGQADQTKITRKFRDGDTLSTRETLEGMGAVEVVPVPTGGRTKEVVAIKDIGREMLAKGKATSTRAVTISFPPSLPTRPQNCTFCGHWHAEEPKHGCRCCERDYDDPDAMFAVHAPSAPDVALSVAKSGQPVTREDVIAAFAEEYHSKVGELFDALVRDGALVAVGRDQAGKTLYGRPSPRDLPPTPDDTPITLEEVAGYVRALPVPNNLWSYFVARALRPVDGDYYVAPGVKATDDDRSALRPMDQRPVRPHLKLDEKTRRHVPDPNSVHEVHQRAVERQLRTLRDLGWLIGGAMPNWYEKPRSINWLLAHGRARDIEYPLGNTAQNASPTDEAVETTDEVPAGNQVETTEQIDSILARDRPDDTEAIDREPPEK